jgi:hypothetical protein
MVYRVCLQTKDGYVVYVDYRSQSWVVVVTVVVMDVEDVVRCRHYRSVVVRLRQNGKGGMRSNWCELYSARMERRVRKLYRYKSHQEWCLESDP